MRNLVAKHNFNRPATHADRSKRPQNTVDEGLLDYYAENAHAVSCEEYERVIGMIPDDSKVVPMVASRIYDSKSVELFINGVRIEGCPLEENVCTIREKVPLIKEFKLDPKELEGLLEFLQQISKSQDSPDRLWIDY